jgi:hypothetical protein
LAILAHPLAPRLPLDNVARAFRLERRIGYLGQESSCRSRIWASRPMMPAAQRPRLEPVSAPVREARLVDRPIQPAYGPAPHAPAALREPMEQLLAAMRIVKGARFNAAARLESRQTASLVTQSMVALYFVGLAVAQAVYSGHIDEATSRLMTFIQIVSSVFTLMLGLLEAMNDYRMKASYLQGCALEVAELAQELQIAQPADPAELQEFRRRYNDALRACPVNHSRLDYLLARYDGTQNLADWITLRLWYAFDVYGLYALFLAVPPLLWWIHQ